MHEHNKLISKEEAPVPEIRLTRPLSMSYNIISTPTHLSLLNWPNRYTIQPHTSEISRDNDETQTSAAQSKNVTVLICWQYLYQNRLQKLSFKKLMGYNTTVIG